MENYNANYLAHYGIKGQHWGVLRGPPYPLNQSARSPRRIAGPSTNDDKAGRRVHIAEPSTNADEARRRVNMARNIAIAAIVGAAAVGAVYMARNHNRLSNLRVSDLRNAVSEVKFGKSDTGDRRSRGLVFTPLSFQAMRNRYRDCAKNMDEIVFPDKKKSLLDQDMKAEEATLAISKAIGKRMRQGTESGDLQAFARAVSGGAINPELSLTYAQLVKLIGSNAATFFANIRTGRDFGDLKNKEAGEVLGIVTNLAEVYRDERD